MVSEKAHKRSSIKNFFAIFLLFAIVAGFTALVIAVCLHRFDNGPKKEETVVEPETEPEPEPEPVIPEINFQPTVDAWVNSTGGNKGVLIYDLDLNKVVGEYNSATKFQTASLYKLFVVYHGYRLVQSGAWDGNVTVNWRGNTILECLDAAIRSSDSSCAEPLWDLIGRSHLDDVVNYELLIPTVTVSSLSATSNEIMQIMKIFYDHTEITQPNLIALMKDSFLNQPTTTYNWRQGLPSGFSDAALVYNKVGWNYSPDARAWTIYDDAAIVEFPAENRHYIVVVMSSYLPYQRIAEFGTQFEAAYHASITAANATAASQDADSGSDQASSD